MESKSIKKKNVNDLNEALSKLLIQPRKISSINAQLEQALGNTEAAPREVWSKPVHTKSSTLSQALCKDSSDSWYDHIDDDEDSSDDDGCVSLQAADFIKIQLHDRVAQKQYTDKKL